MFDDYVDVVQYNSDEIFFRQSCKIKTRVRKTLKIFLTTIFQQFIILIININITFYNMQIVKKFLITNFTSHT